MLHGGIADEAGGAGDQDFSGRHGTDLKGMSGATALRTIGCRGLTLPKCACDTGYFLARGSDLRRTSKSLVASALAMPRACEYFRTALSVVGPTTPSTAPG